MPMPPDERRVASLREYLDAERAEATPLPTALGRALDWKSLEGQTPPAREWIIPYWIPHHHVTLLSGRAGAGKTLIAQHIASAVALGQKYLEELPARRVLMFAGEDDHDELWRRELAIASYFGIAFSEFTGQLELRSCVGEDMTLAAPVLGQLGPTPALTRLKEAVRDFAAELVVIDNIARVFGGNENDRHQVTTFLAWLEGACRPAAVLLIGHPSRAQGSEFSGSSAWEGAVRARLYFGDKRPDEPQSAEEQEPPSSDVRYIARRKSNYSELELRRLRLIDGVLRPDESARLNGSAYRNPAELAKGAVRAALTQLAGRQIFGTASTASSQFLPKLAKQYGLLTETSERDFAQAMRAMILAGELESAQVATYPNRTPRIALRLCTNGVQN